MLNTAAFLRPTSDELSQPFWEATANRKLMLQRCQVCGAFQFPPHERCRRCLGFVTWVESAGRGALYSWTVVYRATHEVFKEWLPYNLALVRMSEGPLMCSRIVADNELDLREGLELRVDFWPIGDVSIPVFKPLGAASGAAENPEEAITERRDA